MPAGAQTTVFNGTIKDLTQAPIPTGQVSFTLRPGVDTVISGNARFASTTIFCEIHNPAVVSTSGTGTITVVVATAQPWLAGDKLLFVGTGDSTLNANTVATAYTVTAVNSPTSFNFTQSGTHTNGAGGTVGGLYASGGTGPCQVTQNTALTPANTSYSVSLWPIFSLTSTFNTYALGAGPVDISTIVPTPGQQPAYSFVDLFSNQNIGGNKNFTGTLTCNGLPCFTGGGGFGSVNDAVFYVSAMNGSDLNNGLSPLFAKLTLNAAIGLCPSTGCTIYYRLGNSAVALPSIVNVNQPATIYVSKGTLICTMADPGTSSGCIVVSSDNVSLFGEGKLTQIIQPGAQNIQTLIYVGTQKNFRMSGILMNTNDNAQTISGNFFTCVRSAAGSADIRIYDNEFTKCGDRAIDLRGENRSWIQRNYFHQTGIGIAGRSTGGNSVSVDVDGTTQSTDCYLEDNLVEEQGDAFACAHSLRVHIRNNTIRGRADFGNTPQGVEAGIDASGDTDVEVIGNHVINARGPQLYLYSLNVGGVNYVTKNARVEGNTFKANTSCCGLAATDPRINLGGLAGGGVTSGQQQNIGFINNTLDGVNVQADTIVNLQITGNSFHNVLSSTGSGGALFLSQTNGIGAVTKNFVISQNGFDTDNASLVTAVTLGATITTPDSCVITDNSTSTAVTNDIVALTGFSSSTCLVSRSNKTMGQYQAGVFSPITFTVPNTFVFARWKSNGSALVVGDLSSSGWGTSPTLAVNNNSTDTAFSLSVTAGTTPSANPTLTLTFHDGTFTASPQCFGVREDLALPIGTFGRSGITATTVTFTLVGTPVAASTYTVEGFCIGH